MSTLINNRTSTMIAFEHPVNEQIRLYLRLEYLFNEFRRSLQQSDKNHSKEALSALLKITSVVDRPDLKSKLVQLLTLHATNLAHLSQSPDIDRERLQDILRQLETHTAHLHAFKGKLGEHLRQNDFLNQIRLHLTNPAGPCESTLPALHLWLNGPAELRAHDLALWYQPLKELDNAIALLMNLIRQSTPPQKLTSQQGFHQQTQDSSLPCELIRVSIPAELKLFPEFSANKHRIIIRFLKPDIYQGGKPIQTQNDVEFLLACCRI
ncbi:MAG: cell division protein ZapD [Coxiella sp. (in: Bacteria)]|nr:MAG: cell division protein ZapD [Coxiella sp. (in: g-proteobacteria)]